MEKQKALALKNFVLEAEVVFQSIFEMGDLYWNGDFEALKMKYSEAEFDRYYDEFEVELRANLLKYSNHTFIKAYLLLFNRNIGSYTAIFDYVIKPGDAEVKDAMKTRLNYILEQIK